EDGDVERRACARPYRSRPDRAAIGARSLRDRRRRGRRLREVHAREFARTARAPGKKMIALLRRWGELVTFSHTIFAMPFAASAVVLALREDHVPLTAARVLAMIGCMIAARTSAMAWNRWVDRDVDAANPRTRSRPVPSGRVAPRE